MNLNGEHFAQPDLETEKAVLGAVLIEPSMWKLTSEVSSDVFSSAAHRKIWSALQRLREEAKPIDIRTLQAELSATGELFGIGGVSYLSSLELYLPDTTRVELYVAILRERRIRIDSQTLCLEAAREFATAPEGEASEVSARLRKRLSDVESCGASAHFISWRDSVTSVVQAATLGDGNADGGVESGFKGLDAITHGFRRGSVYLLAGRPGMGKTSFALNVARNVGMQADVPVALFSLEMGVEEVTMRILSSDSGVPGENFRTRILNDYQRARIEKTRLWLQQSPIHVSDEATMTTQKMLVASRRLKERGGLALVIVDYVQIVRPSRHRENREAEVAEISRDLKSLAREVGVPVVALSQLSRLHVTQNRAPNLSDLRESGALEQDADFVGALHREKDEPKHVATLIALKNRNGRTGLIPLTWNEETTTFGNVDDRR